MDRPLPIAIGLAVVAGLAAPVAASPSGPLPALRAPAPVGMAPPPGSARPITDPATWVTTQDYPAQALRENAEGAVEFLLGIGPDGQVADCRIRASSGSPLLDAATCDLVRRRARFSPATDPSGKPVAGTYSNRVRWVIPRPPRPEPGELTVSYLVAPDGTRSDCRVESAVGGAAEAMKRSNPCMAGRFATGFVDAAGKPVARRVRTSIKVEVLPVP